MEVISPKTAASRFGLEPHTISMSEVFWVDGPSPPDWKLIASRLFLYDQELQIKSVLLTIKNSLAKFASKN
jgi:hypothetical protein